MRGESGHPTARASRALPVLGRLVATGWAPPPHESMLTRVLADDGDRLIDLGARPLLAGRRRR